MSIAIPLAVIITSVASFLPPKSSRRRRSSATGTTKSPPAAGKKRKAPKGRKKRAHKQSQGAHGVAKPLASDEIRVSKDGSFAKFGHMWWPTHGRKLVEHAREALAERDIAPDPSVVTGVVLQLAVPTFDWTDETMRTDAVRRLMQTVHLLVSASMPRASAQSNSAMANAVIERQRRMERPEAQYHEENVDAHAEEEEDEDEDGEEGYVEEDEDESDGEEDEDGDEDEAPELAQVLAHPSSRVTAVEDEPADVTPEPADDRHDEPQEDVPAAGSRRGRTRRGSRGGR